MLCVCGPHLAFPHHMYLYIDGMGGSPSPDLHLRVLPTVNLCL